MPPVVDFLPAIHPGSVLKDELEALGISARKFAARIRVPHNAVSQIISGDRSITAPMAIRLGLAFDTTAQYWLNLQMNYDLKCALTEMSPEALQIEPIGRGSGQRANTAAGKRITPPLAG